MFYVHKGGTKIEIVTPFSECVERACRAELSAEMSDRMADAMADAMDAAREEIEAEAIEVDTTAFLRDAAAAARIVMSAEAEAEAEAEAVMGAVRGSGRDSFEEFKAFVKAEAGRLTASREVVLLAKSFDDPLIKMAFEAGYGAGVIDSGGMQ